MKMAGGPTPFRQMMDRAVAAEAEVERLRDANDALQAWVRVWMRTVQKAVRLQAVLEDIATDPHNPTDELGCAHCKATAAIRGGATQ